MQLTPVEYVRTKVSTTPRTLPRLSADQINALVRAYESGSTVYQLADHFGISRDRVSKHLRAHGFGLRLNRHSMSNAEIATAAQLYDQGQSLVAVGDRLGYNHTTIWRALRRAGVPLRDAHGHVRAATDGSPASEA